MNWIEQEDSSIVKREKSKWKQYVAFQVIPSARNCRKL
jgi:hypothetical protein